MFRFHANSNSLAVDLHGKDRVATTDDVRDSTINVDVDNAVVTLSGTAATQVQKKKAAQVARSVDGVKTSGII